MKIERKKFGWLPKKISGAFMLLSTSPWELFEENIFEKFLQLLWTFFRIISGNWAGKVWPACQNFILRIYRNVFWKKNYFGKQLKIFIIFRHWAGSFRLPVEFFDGDVRTAFYVSKTTFPQRTNFFLIFFFIFGHWAIFFDQFLQKKVAEVSKLDSQFHGNFRVKSF